MNPVEKLYGKRFFSRRYKLHWRAPYICDTLQRLWSFTSIVDVGCATGDIVREMQERGLDSWGVEGSSAVCDFAVCRNLVIYDLRVPGTILPMKFDICLCLEVAEHIEEEYTDTFVDHLVNLSDIVVLSAAPPGQGGHGHVNCKPYEYWKDKFRLRFYDHNSTAVDLFKHFLTPWKKKPGIKAFHQNVLIFEKNADQRT